MLANNSATVSPGSDESVRVVVRCRPFNRKETDEGHFNIIKIDEKSGTIAIQDPTARMTADKNFTFDSTFGESSEQKSVYDAAARPIVDCVLSGYNGTIFAYGQTGTGKTFSMEGNREQAPLRGIIPRSIDQIFEHINMYASSSKKFLVRASFLEIYNEDIYDLLGNSSKKKDGTCSKLELKERPDIGVYVKDLSTFVVKSVEELEKLMSVGNKNRSVGSTLMNERSSRSHSIFSITIETSEILEGDGKEHIRVGKLHLVDLAGSERQAKTGATGDRLKEATKINLSLSALGNVISALVDGKSTHIPYRDSKLTRLLQDSLGGNSKTMMIATVSPASYNFEETMSTLRYANRAKSIKNKPKINEDPKDALLREFQEQIKRLKEQLEAAENNGSISNMLAEQATSGDDDDDDEDDETDVPHENEGNGLDGKTSKPKKKRNLSKTDKTSQDFLEAHEQIEKERQAIMEAKEMIEEERTRLLSELDKRESDIQKEKAERDALAKQLQEMEEKLLVGGVNVLQRTEEQEQELARRAAELEESRKRENDLRKAMENQQEAALQFKQEYSSLQEEASAKSKQLKQLFSYLQSTRSDLKDMKREFSKEREDLLQTIRDFSTQLKFKNTLLHGLISDKMLDKIESKSKWDSENECWRIAYIKHAGNRVNIDGHGVDGIASVLHRRHQYSRNGSAKSFNYNAGYDAGGNMSTMGSAAIGSMRPNTSSTVNNIQEWMGYSAHPMWDTRHIYLSYQLVIPKAWEKIMVLEKDNNLDAAMTNGDVTSKKPRKRADSSFGRKQQQATSVDSKSIKPPADIIPSARGLVSKAKRYA